MTENAADPVRLICGVEFAFPDYKEPLVQLKGAVEGYMRGTLPYAVSDGRLPCAFCDPSAKHWYGRTQSPSLGHANLFDNLGRHVREAHGMSSREYRDAIGLLQSTTLLSRRRYIAASAYSRAHFQLVGKPHTRGVVFSESTRAKIGQARAARGNSPENLNKRGVCRDQILTVARKIAKDNNGVLQMRLLRRQHIWQSSLRRVGFADVAALAAAIGAKPYAASAKRRTDADMLSELRSLAERLGRTPTHRDIEGRGDVASAAGFRLRFGSYTEACRRAGLPLNLPRPITEADEIDILSTFAITGSGERLAQSLHRSWPTVKAVLDKYGVASSKNYRERREAQVLAAEIVRRLAA